MFGCIILIAQSAGQLPSGLQYDLFRGSAPVVAEEEEKYPTRNDKVIKVYFLFILIQREVSSSILSSANVSLATSRMPRVPCFPRMAFILSVAPWTGLLRSGISTRANSPRISNIKPRYQRSIKSSIDYYIFL